MEYAVESQWAARLLADGFHYCSLQDGLTEDIRHVLIIRHYRGWSVEASLKDECYVHFFVWERRGSCAGTANVSPQNAYYCAMNLLEFLREKPKFNTAARVAAIGNMAEANGR